MGATAYIDESIVRTGGGCYVLAAVILPSERKAAVRRAARRLTHAGHARFHWNDEERHDRLAMVDLLKSEATVLQAHVCSPAAYRTHEAVRLRLLCQLLEGLPSSAVDVVVESRQSHNDHADRRVIAAALRTNKALAGLSYGHCRPLDEPLLWLPDALAGAVMAQHRKDTQYVERLDGSRLVLQNL